MNNIIKKSSFGKITFVFLSFSLLLGFYFSEDASGGSAADAGKIIFVYKGGLDGSGRY